MTVKFPPPVKIKILTYLREENYMQLFIYVPSDLKMITTFCK